ncbi:MAG: ATP-binding protein [Archangium sp.]|nr:ATP-binding protein [Archangium sp.]
MSTPSVEALQAEIHRLKEELRVANAAVGSARLWQILDRSLNEIYIFELESLRFEYANAGALKNLGYTLEQMRAMTPIDLKPDHSQASFRALVKPLLAAEREKLVFKTVHRRASGSTYPVEVHLQLVSHGETRVFVAIINDISEREQAERDLKASEERFLAAQKLESVGRLAGGIAHDFNNVLTVIMSYAEVLEEAAPSGPPALDDLREIRAAAERARELTSQLLAFARKRVISPRTISLNAFVSNGVRFWQRALGEDVELSTRLTPAVWPVRLDPTQLEQVILNLAVNARDAMPNGGKLTIETENVTLEPDDLTRRPEMRAGPHVMLVISDTGAGISPEVLPHIFEPFFTTKAHGQGTGLGLATVYGIVRQSGGHVWVYSELGVGTTFKLYFPRSQSAEDALVPAEPTTRRATNGFERILVVEDDETIRAVVVRALRDVGYQVTGAARPDEALTVAAGASFDLLLSDVVMPGMNGRQLADLLQRAQPSLRVLFVSGYTENTIIHHGVLDEGVDFLAKPFTPSQLREHVRVLLDRPR